MNKDDWMMALREITVIAVRRGIRVGSTSQIFGVMVSDTNCSQCSGVQSLLQAVKTKNQLLRNDG